MRRTNYTILKYILPIMALVVMFRGTAWAEDTAYSNYARLSSGFYQPTSDLDKAGYDSGGDLAIAFGRYFGKHLVLEGGLGFLYTERDVVGNVPVAGFYVEDDSVSVLSITLTAKGVYPIGRFELYGGGGIGGYIVSLYADVTSANLGNVDTDDSDTVLGFHAVGGFNFKITERFLLGAEVKYLWTDDVDISKQISDIPIRLQGDLDGYSVNITFGFRF
ncbi:MAG: outer membrane beta-barrel protein [Thermodesulfobacteriota bacterium]